MRTNRGNKNKAKRIAAWLMTAAVLTPAFLSSGTMITYAKDAGLERYDRYSDTAVLIDERRERVKIIGEMTDWGSEEDIREIWDELNGYEDEYGKLAEEFNGYAKLASLADDTGYTAENIAEINSSFAEYKDTARLAPDGEKIYAAWTDTDGDGTSEAVYFIMPGKGVYIFTDSSGNPEESDLKMELYEKIAFIGGDPVECTAGSGELSAKYDTDKDGNKEYVSIHISGEGVMLTNSSGGPVLNKDGGIASFPETAGELSRRTASKLSSLKDEIGEAKTNLKLAEEGLRERTIEEEKGNVAKKDNGISVSEGSYEGTVSEESIHRGSSYKGGSAGTGETSSGSTETPDVNPEEEQSPNKEIVVDESLEVLKAAVAKEDGETIDDSKISTDSNNYKSGYQTGFAAAKTYMQILGSSAEPEVEVSEGAAAEILGSGNTYADGFKDGYDSGYSDGKKESSADYSSGLSEGYSTGYDAGYDDGYKDGTKDSDAGHAGDTNAGYTEGYNAGYTEGFNDGEESGKAGRTLDTDINVASASYSGGYSTGYNEGYVAGVSAATGSTGTGEDGTSASSPEVAALQAQIASLTKEVESLTSKNASLTSELTALTTSNTKLSSELSDSKKDIKDLEDDLDDLEDDNKDLKKDNSSLKSANSDLSGKVNSLSGEIDNVKNANTALSGKVDSLTGEVTTLTDTNKGLNEKNTDLQGRNTDLESRITSLEERTVKETTVSGNRNLTDAVDLPDTAKEIVKIPDNNPYKVEQISALGRTTLTSVPGAEETADNYTPLSDTGEYKGTITAHNVAQVYETGKDEKAVANRIYAYFTDPKSLSDTVVTDPEYKERLNELGAAVKITALASVDLEPTAEQQEAIQNNRAIDLSLLVTGMKEGNDYMLVHQNKAKKNYDVILTRAGANGIKAELNDLSPVAVAEVTITEKEEEGVTLGKKELGDLEPTNEEQGANTGGILYKENGDEDKKEGGNSILLIVIIVVIAVAAIALIALKVLPGMGSSGAAGKFANIMSLLPGKKKDADEGYDDDDDDLESV